MTAVLYDIQRKNRRQDLIITSDLVLSDAILLLKYENKDTSST